jgi:RecB family exonuclease
VRRFLAWRDASSRRLAGVEVPFSVEVAAGARTALLRGQVDRLEVLPDGRGVVIDLKTGTGKPRDADVADNPQLAAYQLAVEQGAFADHGIRGSAGASLLQIGKAAGSWNNASGKEQAQPPLSDAPDPGWAARLVADVATGMAGSTFLAQANDRCQVCPVRSSCPLQEEGHQVVGA